MGFVLLLTARSRASVGRGEGAQELQDLVETSRPLQEGG